MQAYGIPLYLNTHTQQKYTPPPHTHAVQGLGFRVYALGITVGEEEDSLAFLFDPLSPAAR